MIKRSLILLLIVSFFSACTIQKRLYTNGYNIVWKNKNYSQKEKINDFEDENKSDLLVNNLTNIPKEKSISESIISTNTIIENKKIIERDINKSIKKKVTVDRKTYSPQILKSSLSNKITTKFKLKENKNIILGRSSDKEGVSIFVKLGIILLGIGVICLIVTFWAWWLTIIGLTNLGWYTITLFIGMGALIGGLAMLIAVWLTN